MIFGTDGLRARMNESPLDSATIRRLSAVIRADLPAGARLVLGCDSRESCAEIRAWISASWADLEVLDLGEVPTPVVAFETKAREAALGVMITASHNPACDNGLKFFDPSGLKVAYERALRWSDAVEALSETPVGVPASLQKVKPDHYKAFISNHFQASDFSGLSLAFDFANGAAWRLGQEILTSLGLNAPCLGITPDGSNINLQIGALHPEALLSLVQQRGLLAGFALDGDGDRLVVVDSQGELNGDLTLYIMKEIYQREGTPLTQLVATLMAGLGFERQLKAQGIELVRTAVGDQNVLAELVSRGLLLGGETSGHLIQADLFPAGDGLLAALRIARALACDPDLLSRARAEVPIYPLFEKAYRVRHKPALEELPLLAPLLAELRKRASDARMVVRYSGTEPKLRVTLETEDLEPFRELLAQIEAAIALELA